MSRPERRVAAGVLSLVLSLASTACSSAPIGMGQDPEIVWWTDNESGDFRDWMSGGPSVGHLWLSGSSAFVVSTDQARSGKYSIRATITTGGFGGPGSVPGSESPPTLDGALAIRAMNLPAEGYYSAWYYLQYAAFASDYWLVFKLRGRTSPSDPTTTVELWDIDLGAFSPGSPSQGLALDLFRHTAAPNVARQPRIANPPPIPLNRWFQIEAFYRPTSDATGQLTVWQDGVIVFDFEDQPTAPSSYVEWSVGSVSDGLSPPTATIYIDDAAVSLRRLGPSFPPFSRAD